MLRIVYLFASIASLIISRIQPFTDSNYGKYCRITKNSSIIFLTDIFAVFSIIYFILGLFLAIIKRQKFVRTQKKQFIVDLEKFYRYSLFFMLICNSTVTAGFWVLFSYNKRLLMVKAENCNYSVPFWKNLIDHSIPLLTIILEMFFYEFQYTKYSLFAILVTLVAYYLDICIYHHFFKVWPYTIMNRLSYPMIFITCCMFLLCGSIVGLAIFNIIQNLKLRFKKTQKFTYY